MKSKSKKVVTHNKKKSKSMKKKIGGEDGETIKYNQTFGFRNAFFINKDCDPELKKIVQKIENYTKDETINDDEYDEITNDFNILIQKCCGGMSNNITPFCKKVKELKDEFIKKWNIELDVGIKSYDDVSNPSKITMLKNMYRSIIPKKSNLKEDVNDMKKFNAFNEGPDKMNYTIKGGKRKNKTNKIRKTKLNKKRKNKTNKRKKGGNTNTDSDANTVAYTDMIAETMHEMPSDTSKLNKKQFLSHAPGIGRSGLGVRNRVKNTLLKIKGVDTSNCNKEDYDTKVFEEKEEIFKKCCGNNASSPFCRYVKKDIDNRRAREGSLYDDYDFGIGPIDPLE